MTIRFTCMLVGAGLLFGNAFVSDTRAQTAPTYSVDWHLINSGGSTLVGGTSRSSCFVVNGTVAQPVPGYSSGGIYSVYAGFWVAAQTTGNDEIFYNSFEGCNP